MTDLEADYIIVGAGTAGLVLAHRLKKKLPSSSIIVIEAGGDNSTHEHTQSFAGLFPIQATSYNWAIQSTTGLHEQNIAKVGSGGKALGGSATINAGVWFRGPAADYDTWAEIAGDPAWRYENMIPFFKLAENLQDEVVMDEAQHAEDGYLKVWSARARLSWVKWPLRDSQKAAWKEAGIAYVPDTNNGQPNGLGEQFDVWDRGHRQFASKFLDLKDVKIISGVNVERVTFNRPGDVSTATGVNLADGRSIKVRKEVIISAGTYNSPNILMLSGVGDRKTLTRHGIDCLYDNPSVGQNLSEHLTYATTLRLKEPAALGATALAGPEFAEGFPADFSYHGQLENISRVGKAGASAEEQKYLSRPGSSNVQTCLWYQPFHEAMTGVPVPNDGTIVSAVTCLVSPTSRGSVAIQSSNPKDPPTITQNFYTTKADQFVMRESIKLTSRVYTETESSKSFIKEELVPPGLKPVLEQTDDEIDARVRRYAWSIQHPMGTCSLGSVVDSHCRVRGVEGLRVVDASIMPTPLGCNTQCATYAIAERVAEWIGNGE